MSAVDASRRRRGSALLAVLWTIIALTAIGFALSANVRTEIDRASLNVDSTKAYFLAHGAIETAMHRIVRPQNPDNPDDGFAVGQRFMHFQFESGSADVEIVGESGKLDINQATAPALARLLSSAGVEGGRAVAVAAGIVEFRARLQRGQVRSYGAEGAEQTILTSDSSFDGQPASIQEVEELLAVPGMTPDLLYGTFREVALQVPGGKRGTTQQRLMRTGGLMRNLTPKGSTIVNVNYASPEMLIAAGLPTDLVAAVEQIRVVRPLTADDPGMGNLGNSGSEINLGLGGASKRYTLTATARLGDTTSIKPRAVRSVSAVVELGTSDGPDPIRIVRWYDQPF